MFKQMAKTVCEHVAGTLEYLPPLRGLVAGDLTVFIYHEVSDSPSEFCDQYGLAVSKETFKAQISWIKNNFNIIHPQQLLGSKDNTLPKRAALITFDDGFDGAFKNGIAHLVGEGIPSLMFLNMRTVLEERPMLSALALYLEKYQKNFKAFLKSENLSSPVFLHIKPEQLEKYETVHGPIDLKEALSYQGKVAHLNEVKKWANNDLVVFGNHLFDHWNSAALSESQFEEQYQNNVEALKKVNCDSKFFSFTNGQPGICFGEREIGQLQKMGAERIFFSKGYTNADASAYLLDRVFPLEHENTNSKLWLRFSLDALTRNSNIASTLLGRSSA